MWTLKTPAKTFCPLFGIYRNTKNLCNILPVGHQRILINNAVSGYCRRSLQISMMLYIKDVRDNNGDRSVFFNTGSSSETSVLSQSCHVLCTVWVCLIHMSGYITYEEGKEGKETISLCGRARCRPCILHSATPQMGAGSWEVWPPAGMELRSLRLPWSPGGRSLQSHEDLAGELAAPEQEDQGSRKNRTDCVQMSNFPFHCVLGISDNISQQIIKCTEVCFFPSWS